MVVKTRSPALLNDAPKLSLSLTTGHQMNFTYTDVCSQETLFPFADGFAKCWMATN